MSLDYKTVACSHITLSQLMLPSHSNFSGKIHGGYLLSLMDQIAFACGSKFSGKYCVTASVDRVDFLSPIEVGELVTLNASVNFVGTSSMVVGIRVDAQNIQTGQIKHCNSSYFTMIAKDADTGKPVAVILRPGKTPDGAEVALVLRHVIGAIRRRWPKVDVLVRGDSHYGRPEAMSWCERHRVAYLFGLAGNQVLLARVAALAEAAALDRVEGEATKVRRYDEFRYAAKSWDVERRVIARVEASDQGSDSRFVVTNRRGAPRWLYEDVYCARGQAENLIKAHKLHLASDRTSCTKATANQFRLVLHTAAYWLLHTLRGLAPKRSFWRDAQFDTLRLAFIKVAARVTELTTRIKVALPSSYPYRDSLILLAAHAAKPP